MAMAGVGRRGFLQATALGAVLQGVGANRLIAQDAPKTKTKEQPKAKAKTAAPVPLAAPAPAPAPLKASEALNRVLAPVRNDNNLPGLIGGIVAGNTLTAIGAVGIRKIGATQPITVDDHVHIGSCTKAMTATLIGRLIDEGKLTWQTTLGELFPQKASDLPSDVQGLTITHLLTHRSGLPHDAPSWWNLPGRTPAEQRLALLDGPLKDRLLSKPGTKYEYSNFGYVVAGLMAEQATGRSWEDLMRERLFKPLAMTSAGFGPPGTRGKVDEPWGHHLKNGAVVPVQGDNPAAMGPAGTVHCTMADWAKFAILHLRAAAGKPELLKASTFRVLHTPPAGSDYAGGWTMLQRSWAGGYAMNHNGSNTMWYCGVWLAPARNFAILAATNLGGDEAAKGCDQAVEALIRYHLTSRTNRR
jgi:CubicO group peptidase (beta-lactamase class C family)